MSQAKVCDRCGKTFKINNSLSNLFKIGSDVSITVNGYRHKEYDLCDKCLSDFYEFMKNKEVENGKPNINVDVRYW